MKKILMLLSTVILIFGMLDTASANLITNGDFETGHLTGWTHSGDVDVVKFSPSSFLGRWAKVQGMNGYFALLGGDTSSGNSTLSQNFTVSGATSIRLAFDYAFDYLDLNSSANDTFMALTTYTGDVVGTITMRKLLSSCLGANYGHYEETFNLNPAWTLNASMSFTLSEVGGLFSGRTNSVVGIDNVNVAPVPEPATILLLGMGLLGLAGFGRKSFRKKA